MKFSWERKQQLLCKSGIMLPDIKSDVFFFNSIKISRRDKKKYKH